MQRLISILAFLLFPISVWAAEPTPVSAASEAPVIPPHLSLDAAVTLFHQRGFDLLIAAAAVESAEGDLTIAGSLANPNLSVSGGKTFDYNPANCPGCSAIATSVGIDDQALIGDLLTGKHHLRTSAARAALEAVRASGHDVERTATMLLKEQYAQAALAAQNLSLDREIAASTTDTFGLNQKKYHAGDIGEVDLARSETAKLEADQAVATASGQLDQARAGLAFFLGVRGAVPAFDIDADLLHRPLPPELASASSEALLTQAFDHRPDLAAQRKQVERADAALRLARRNRVPDITLSLQEAQEGTGQNALQPPTVTVGLSAAVPVFYLQQGEIRKADADLRTQIVTENKLEAQVSADISTAWSAFQTSRGLVARMDAGLLASAKKANDLVEIQYRAGGISMLEFLDAQRTYKATALEYLQDLANQRIAVFQLEAAVGVEYER